MKKVILFVAIVLISAASIAQPNLFNYQGIARNASGSPLSSKTISLRISILDSIITGTPVYVETHGTTTSSFGLFNIAIGGGTVVTGHMDSIKWGENNKFIKVEMDTAGGTSYITISTTQLLSVPYALYARHSGTSGINITAFQPDICNVKVDSVDTVYKKIKDIGTFTTYSTGSKVQIDLQTAAYISSGIGSFVIFEIRVDGAETTNGVAATEQISRETNINITGIFSGLSAGTHTLSVWVRSKSSTSFPGLMGIYLDYFCSGSKGANNVIVKEYQ